MNPQTKIAILKRKKWYLFNISIWMALFIIFIINKEYILAFLSAISIHLIQLNDSTEDLKDAIKSFKEDLSFKIVLNGYAIIKDESGKTEIEVTWDKTEDTRSIHINHES